MSIPTRILKAQALANKQYKSIIRLFNHCGIEYGADFNLSRAKKQLQAEFRIAKDGLIELDGLTYSQHEVFEEIENPDFQNRLVYHQQIWDSPELLDLLEQSEVDFSTLGEAFKPFWKNKEFDRFFSPYFAGPFNYLARTFLSGHNLGEMGELLAYEDFLQPAEREEAFRPIRIFLDDNARLLRNVTKANYNIMRPKMAHWIDEEWHPFFNHLPIEFYDVKLDITTRLINIGAEVQKTQKRDVKKTSSQLVMLTEMPSDIRSIIFSNHEAYHATRGIRLREGWWVVWIIIVLFRAVSSDACSSSSNSNKFNARPNDYKIILDSATKKKVDSIWKSHTDKKYKK